MNERDRLYRADTLMDAANAQYERVVAENERLRAELNSAYSLLNQPVYGHTSVSDNACKVMRADAALIRDRIRAALAACEVRHE